MNIQEKFNQVLPSHISLDYNCFIEKHAPNTVLSKSLEAMLVKAGSQILHQTKEKEDPSTEIMVKKIFFK